MKKETFEVGAFGLGVCMICDGKTLVICRDSTTGLVAGNCCQKELRRAHAVLAENLVAAGLKHPNP